MAERLTKTGMFMSMAKIVASRSTCRRNQVGCVITDWEGTSVVSLGYNGNARGLENTCDRPDEQGNCGCVHAELNALIKAPFRDGRLKLYTTTAPCPNCAKLIINSAVRCVIYLAPYRTDGGLELLRQAEIPLVHLRDKDWHELAD